VPRPRPGKVPEAVFRNPFGILPDFFVRRGSALAVESLEKKESRGAPRQVAAGLVSLAAGLVLGGLAGSDGLSRVLLVAAGFLGLVVFVHRALVLWNVDALLFENPSRRPRLPAPPRQAAHARRCVASRRNALRVVGLAAISLLSSVAVPGQQTVFNVPSADILNRDKIYVETDWLWRPIEPRFSSGGIRAVYGAGNNVEVGVNLGGFAPQGRSAIVAVPNLKWQPHHSDTISLTTGMLALVRVGGTGDHTPAVLGYAHAAMRLPIGTRLTAGGWMASSNYAGSDVERGGLFGLEQPIVSDVTLAADWYTGRSGLGYASPGLIITHGRWVLYASYTFKNGDSKGSGLLLEMGFTP
jgi:hypothetical protein